MPTKLALIASALALASAALGGGAPADTPRKLKSDPKQEYYVYLPKGHDPNQECGLFVAIHAANETGAGAAGWSGFASEGKCIVVAPTFKGDFSQPAKGSGDKLKAILGELRKEFKLDEKVFLTGYDQGALFAVRFAMDNPSLVLGVAGHSADGWGTPDAKARHIPFLITCGRDDKEGDRIGDAQKFAKALKDKKFNVESAWHTKVAHAYSPQARAKTKEFYLELATGMNAPERAKADSTLAKANGFLKGGKYAEAAATARELIALKPNASYVEKANAVLKQVLDDGKAKLAQIDAQAKSDPNAAGIALDKLKDQFYGTPVADAAAERAKSLAAAAPGKGGAAAEKGDPAKAAEKCRAWLRTADNYVANGKTGDARLLLYKIIETYPDTEFAARAKEKLDKLP